MKQILTLLIFTLFVSCASAQSSFVEFQQSYPRVNMALHLKEDTLKKQFAAAGLQWPAKQLYIRSFKYDSQMEVWVRNSNKDPYKLFKTYKVCAMAGTLGPKRMQGDYQVPEGFYYINEFNPNSTYHLSLGINYPNMSDRILSDSAEPGGDIYIHGSCLTVGCIPIQDSQIEELYILATYAKNSGQDFIPVHIFPVRYNNVKSVDYLSRIIKDDKKLAHFSSEIKKVYEYFEANKKLPLISVNNVGDYVIL